MKKVLFIHGFSAKKEDNEYFIKYLKKHKNIKLNTFILPGHSEEKVTYVTYQKWLDKAEKEFLKLNSNKVIIIGHSMGAVIAAHLASKYKISKLILLSPAYYFGSLKQNKEDLKNIIFHKETKDTGFEGVLTKIKTVSIRSALEYYKLSHIGRKDLEKITCPVLIMHGDKDPVISINSSKNIMNKLQTKKEFVKIKDVRHQIFKSEKKKQISKYIYRYICGGLIYFITRKEEI